MISYAKTKPESSERSSHNDRFKHERIRIRDHSAVSLRKLLIGREHRHLSAGAMPKKGELRCTEITPSHLAAPLG